jgi:hypothetical protein
MTKALDNVPAADLPRLLREAIAAETACFRAEHGDHSEASEARTTAALDKVLAVHSALLAVPVEQPLLALELNGCMEHLLALALFRKRWLVMEGAYADPADASECRMVDLLLAGTAFDAVPLLWHLNGEPCDERPSAAEFEAARAMRDERKAA